MHPIVIHTASRPNPIHMLTNSFKSTKYIIVVARIPITPEKNPVVKACDIHLSIDLDRSSTTATGEIEKIKAAFFEKKTSEGNMRIYSITCDSAETGFATFKMLSKYAANVSNLYGKMKFERTVRVFRKPYDAPMLPLSKSEELDKWLQNQS